MADQRLNTNPASSADGTVTNGESRNNARSKRRGARSKPHRDVHGNGGNSAHNSPLNSAETQNRATGHVGSNGSNHPAAARSLEEAVLQELERYFIDLEGVTASGVYAMVVRTVERPMLEVVLQKTGGNQLKAAEVLGINRNTLRKKIQQHGLTPGKLADTGAGT
jgi:Fis family transcriptional regulator